MPQTRETFLTTDQGALLARAIMRLSAAIDNVGCRVNWSDEVQGARALALDLIPPGHDFSKRTPAASCDCATGDDCEANGAAEEKPDPRFYETDGTLKEWDQVANADFAEYLRIIAKRAIKAKEAAANAAEQVVVGVDVGKDGLTASALLVKDGVMSPICDAPDCACADFEDCASFGMDHIPTPSCDAPSCDCATGEDCKANGPAETQAPLGTRKTADFTRTAFIDVGQSGVTLWEDPLVGSIVATNPSGSRVAIMRKGREVSLVDGPCSELIMVRYQAKVDAEPKFADKLRAPISLKDDDLTAKVTGDGAPITLSKPGAGRCFSVQELWDLPDVSDPIATMSGIQSRLNGLTAKVDALAERRDGKAEEDGGPYLVNPNPRFIHTVVVLSEVKEPWSRGYEWRIKGNGAVQIGTLVCAPSEGQTMEVIDMRDHNGGGSSIIVKLAKED